MYKTQDSRLKTQDSRLQTQDSRRFLFDPCKNYKILIYTINNII